jgi:signal transduction histidine kinase
MIRESLRNFLLPREESIEPGFREEIVSLSVVGLRTISAVTVLGLVVLLAIGGAFPEFREHRDADIGLLFLSLGAAGYSLTFWRRVRSRARAIGLVIGYTAAMVSLAAMMRTHYPLSVDMVHAHMPIIVTLALLVLVVSLPLKPAQTLVFGIAMLAGYLVLTAVLRTTAELTGMIAMHVLLELLVILVGCGLSTLLYQQRMAGFRSRRFAEDSFEQLKAAQARLLLSRSAASQSRLAAAIAHEFATPIGAFASAVDTLQVTMEKLLASNPAGGRLGTTAREALRVAHESSDRLRQTLARLKNVTNLDGAVERVVDLNDLLGDTIHLLESEIGERARFRFDRKPLPGTRCRPEQISAVFSNLLRNAAAALDERGLVEVRTSASRGEIVSEVRDNGRGMTPEVLERLFDPEFRVEGRRVTTSHWGLFVSRSIILDHGGDIEVESIPGRGTTVRVALPVR